jgi:hypothetical protein
MLWRREWLLLIVFAGALAVAALLGRAAGPDRDLEDLRRSTMLAGPAGAKGLAEALRRLGMTVERRRAGLAGLNADSGVGLLAILEPPIPLSSSDIRAVSAFVDRGGSVFLAGRMALGECFGFAARLVGRQTPPVVPPVAGWRLPRVRWVLARQRPAEACVPLGLAVSDTLLRTTSDRPVAVALRGRGGGRVILLADAGLVANRALKETDAGLVVLPWFLAQRPGSVTFDEYHQGFGAGRSLTLAVARWLAEAPAGWAMLQLAAAGLLALAVLSVRFGPVGRLVERRRRSELEHVEALASGLERSAGGDAAVALLVSGLRRRLRRAGAFARGDPREWLGSLAATSDSKEAQRAARRLVALMGARGGGERVLAAARAVEDAWESLSRESGRRAS